MEEDTQGQLVQVHTTTGTFTLCSPACVHRHTKKHTQRKCVLHYKNHTYDCNHQFYKKSLRVRGN